jgi:hypothetical protein
MEIGVTVMNFYSIALGIKLLLPKESTDTISNIPALTDQNSEDYLPLPVTVITSVVGNLFLLSY